LISNAEGSGDGMAIPHLRIVPAIKNNVLIIDDQATSRAILEEVARNLDHGVRVESFARPIDAVVWAATNVADLVLIDYLMPEMDGIELARRLRGFSGYEHVPFVMVTVKDDRKVRYDALDAGITDFLNKPVDTRECLARCRNLMTLRRQQLILEDRHRTLETLVQEATRDVRERERETLIRLARAGEFRDSETGNHVMRMARFSGMIAKAIGMDAEYVETIERAAPLHDIGKIGIPDHVLRKPGPLDEDERRLMRGHPAMGHEILKDSPSKYLRMGALIALGHHEKVDGSGYPSGLMRDQIPLPARIVAVADVFDALTTVRPYKSAWTSDQSFAYLAAQSGSHFDGQLVEAFGCIAGDVIRVQRELRDIESADPVRWRED
jgi:two-component system response regulator RpfG